MNFCAVGHEVHDGHAKLVDDRIELRIAKIDHARRDRFANENKNILYTKRA